MNQKIKENFVALVVEDELPLQEAVKKKLEISGFKVVTARSVAQAEEYLKEIEKINVIWLDHYLVGKENGLDLVIKVKGNNKWKSIPIFVVSNTASPDKVKSYISFGVSKYYTKADYRLDQIITDIKKVLKIK
jgi:CheY-like chemotaxis protein